MQIKDNRYSSVTRHTLFFRTDIAQSHTALSPEWQSHNVTLYQLHFKWVVFGLQAIAPLLAEVSGHDNCLSFSLIQGTSFRGNPLFKDGQKRSKSVTRGLGTLRAQQPLGSGVQRALPSRGKAARADGIDLSAEQCVCMQACLRMHAKICVCNRAVKLYRYKQVTKKRNPTRETAAGTRPWTNVKQARAFGLSVLKEAWNWEQRNLPLWLECRYIQRNNL